MARTVRDARLESKTARLALPASPEPRWKALDAGIALGYRRNKRGGVWLARRWDVEKKRYREEAIGRADDMRDADGEMILNYSQAQAEARAWGAREHRIAEGLEERVAGSYTVAAALDAYFKAREDRRSRGLYSDRCYADARIVPQLGAVPLAKLTTTKIKTWLRDTAAEPRRLRTKPGAEQKMAESDASDHEADRARRASANRILTILKAGLNFAFHDGKAADDSTWRRVKPFKMVDEPRVRFLTAEEAARLVQACPQDFAELVRGALLTGCRYGELTTLRVSDFNAQAGTIHVRQSKSGKPRHVILTAEGQRFFAALAADRLAEARLFVRADGGAWGKSHQQRPLIEASGAAKIAPAVNFHVLRHTYASAAVNAGLSLEIIAEQLGHVDTRITRRHYAHLDPGHVAQAIRARMPDLGAAS